MARWRLELAWLLVGLAQIGYSAMVASSIRPPDGDTSWWACAETCEDVSLCSPLSPQPERRREVVAPLAGGARDLFAYGANGSEWKLWLDPEISGGKITTIPVFNSVAGGFSGGTNRGLLCAAHRLGDRVVDWDTVAGIYGPFEFVNFPERILNNTARDIWIEMAVHFMVASGIDGFALDIEVGAPRCWRCTSAFTRLSAACVLACTRPLLQSHAHILILFRCPGANLQLDGGLRTSKRGAYDDA